MLDVVKYQPGIPPVNTAPPTVVVPPQPVTGRYLAHNKLSRVERAFLASDLVNGDKRLIRPTIRQAAMLAGVNATYAWWAGKQEANRLEIEAGYLPLVPARAQAPISDPEIIDFVRTVGLERVLDAAVAVEAAQ